MGSFGVNVRVLAMGRGEIGPEGTAIIIIIAFSFFFDTSEESGQGEGYFRDARV
jgi:hypothetical protein